MQESWTYILRCRDGSYYTGCTTNLDRRIAQHQSGTLKGYTSTRLPVTLVWSSRFDRIHDAIAVERQIKRWSRRKKEALIRGDMDALRLCAKKKWKQ
ncbi:MAG: GIY-YIG nuclease family protein [Bacteroidetes bacterium]|nr:GIY-YIG nuclease family protein [Bacteroidota bacterium]